MGLDWNDTNFEQLGTESIPDRRDLHNKIVDQVLRSSFLVNDRNHEHNVVSSSNNSNNIYNNKQWLLLMAGPMGSGKSFAIQWMLNKNIMKFNDGYPCIIDPDHIRQQLPEWDSLNQHNCMTAGYKTQKEAGLIAEIALYKALNSGMNVVFDSTLRDVKWFEQLIVHLKQSYVNLNIGVIHVWCDRSTAIIRTQKRHLN